MRIVSVAAALLVLAGCAAENGNVGAKTPVTVVADSSAEVVGKTKIRCHKETPPGSNVIQNVCETDRSEADRQAMQYQIMNALQQNKGVHPPPGTP
jgi:uncharacterized lipoprotein YbaY